MKNIDADMEDKAIKGYAATFISLLCTSMEKLRLEGYYWGQALPRREASYLDTP